MIRMKRSTRPLPTSLPKLLMAAPIAGLLLLGACSSEPDPDASAALPAPKPVTSAPPDETMTFAKAVSDGKPGAAVTIRYEFSSKPNAGTPTDLDIAFIPNAGVDSLEATIGGMEGITLAGQQTASFSAVESGKAYRHKLSVLPDRSGVYYITVSVNTQIAGSSLSRTFSIPFVVGQVSVQQKAEPQRDAKGEAIEPMKAQESSK
jgi:hypothetical protein